MFRNIIINFPTNLGDAILTFCAVDLIRASYPESRITGISSFSTFDLLSRYSSIDEVIIYDKHWPVQDKKAFCKGLRGRYDLMIDFKHTLLPIILKVKKYTPLIRWWKAPLHVKERYVSLVSPFLNTKEAPKGKITLKDEEKKHLSGLKLKPAILVATYSRSHLKVYPPQMLEEVLKDGFSEYPVILLGDADSASYYRRVHFGETVIDLSGKTSLAEVYYIMANYCRVILCVDSSLLHLASYLNLRIVALFGPTDEKCYGPFSSRYKVLTNSHINCRPCKKASCYRDYSCMRGIKANEVKEALEAMLRS